MKNLLVLAGLLVIVAGIFFASDRVRLAFQVGAVIYAVVLVIRFLYFGIGDPDSFLDLLILLAVFFLIWVAAWAGTEALLRYRRRSGPPST